MQRSQLMRIGIGCGIGIRENILATPSEGVWGKKHAPIIKLADRARSKSKKSYQKGTLTNLRPGLHGFGEMRRSHCRWSLFIFMLLNTKMIQPFQIQDRFFRSPFNIIGNGTMKKVLWKSWVWEKERESRRWSSERLSSCELTLFHLRQWSWHKW